MGCAVSDGEVAVGTDAGADGTAPGAFDVLVELVGRHALAWWEALFFALGFGVIV